MADPNHLERMGRELNCPICLSLLNSAASLSCNHIFCNSCILKSMKSASTCPICKVPFHRREVRPAPHMDNLVSIYRNMEVASGLNMFVTQVPQPATLSDGKNKSDRVPAEGEAMKKTSSKGNRARKPNNSNLENSSPLPIKPSCPTKKRVQVPQHPSVEAAAHAANPDNVLRKLKVDGPMNISAESGTHNEDGERVFRPFFWLRGEEEDEERSTQNTDADEPYGTQIKVPTFSDLKDSQDEMPSTSTKEVDWVSAGTDFIDSEMFEWTQRPCSPGLCSSSSELQVSDNNDQDLESALRESISAEGGHKPRKRGRPAKSKSPVDSLENKASEGCQQERTYTRKKTAKRREKGAASVTETEIAYENTSAGILDGSSKSAKGRKTNFKKMCEINTPFQKDSRATSKKRKLDSAVVMNESSTARKMSEAGPNGKRESNIKKNTVSTSLAASEAKLVLRKCKIISEETKCAFCQCSQCSEASGEMVHYRDGRPVSADQSDGSRIIHSHKNCVEWAPNVYFEDDKAINLEAELARSRRIKCSCCGIKGAALGCFEKSCRKSFHFTCAKMIPQCRWDDVNFVVLCPLHESSKLPTEAMSKDSEEKPRRTHDQLPKKNAIRTSFKGNYTGPRDKIFLCCSTLTAAEREIVSKFERSSRATVMHKWDSRVTHVIASTDENGACRRTLKVLMGILEGKWILTVDWIKACMEAKEHVDEEKYEITVDVHGMRGGPRLGRLRVLHMQPKLFEGLKFYFTGVFLSSYRGYLQDLVIAAGGTILHRKPVSGDHAKPGSATFIVYNLETSNKPSPSRDTALKQRKSDAEAVASSTGAQAVSNSWILNSIAACKLQDF